MTLLEQLQSFDRNSKTSIPQIKDQDIKKLYKEAQLTFRGSGKYNWKVKDVLYFVKSNHIIPSNFILFFEHLVKLHFNRQQSSKGLISVSNFINKLKNSQDFIGSSPLDNRIILNEDANVYDLLTLRIKEKALSNISHKEMVENIIKDYNTGYTYATLYRMYFAEKK